MRFPGAPAVVQHCAGGPPTLARRPTADGGAPESSGATWLGLKVLVRSVAKGRTLRVFALAPSHSLGLANLDFQGRELCSFVGAVAKGLLLGLPASAPIIGSFFDLLNRRGFLSNDWSLHRQFAVGY